jgi:hypothetical protein
VHRRIVKHVTTNQIFTDSQHGFRLGRSTESATYHFVERLHQEIDKGRPTATVFFDLTKVFDVVDHNFIETKLYSIGLRGTILKWLMSFLSNRQLTVKINNKTSKVFETNIGVAQGSVLGPLIFLIFINELPLYIKNGLVTIFADDTSVNILCQQRNLHDTYTFFSIDPEIGNTLAVVTIRHSKVQIELWEPIHAGTYVVHLFQRYCHNDDACLQGFIRKKKIENHKCSEYLGLFYTFVKRRFVAPAHDQRIICDTSRDGMRLTCNLEVCCPKEILQGDEKFITSMGTFVAILSRGSLANPQEKQCSESPREQKTTLKQHFCMYCGKLKTCLARHLQKVLSDEDQVRNLICLKGREKQKALRSIRLLGDKEYNEKVKPHKRIAVRKPVLQLISESLHCPVCNVSQERILANITSNAQRELQIIVNGSARLKMK